MNGDSYINLKTNLMKIIYTTIILALLIGVVLAIGKRGPTEDEQQVLSLNQPTESVPITIGGGLQEYNSSADLLNLTGVNILFFKASWCITCTTLYEALVKEESKIPKGITIWVVDYDSNKAMRIKYGVTTQHTLVQIDNNREKLNLWRGGFTLSDVISHIKY